MYSCWGSARFGEVSTAWTRCLGFGVGVALGARACCPRTRARCFRWSRTARLAHSLKGGFGCLTFLGALFTSGRLRLLDPLFGRWSLCRPGRTGTRPRAGALCSLQCWLAEDLSAPADSLPRELRRFLVSPLGPRCSSLPRAFYARCAAAPVASCALFVSFHLAAENSRTYS